MNQQIEIRKAKSAFYTAAAVAVIFTMLAILFLVYSEDTGGFANPVFWLFSLPAVLGWYMIADYAGCVMIISEDEIISKGLSGKETRIPMSEVQKVGTKKAFIFIYGEKNHVLTSMEADLNQYEEAAAIFRKHGIPIVSQDFRKLIDKKSSEQS